MEAKEKFREMKTYELIWELIKYKPLLSFINGLTWLIFQNSPLIPGLIIKRIFDSLSNDAPANSGLWGLCVLLVVFALVRCLVMYAGLRFDVLHRFSIGSLLKKICLR